MKIRVDTVIRLVLITCIIVFVILLLNPTTSFASGDDCRGNSCNGRGDINVGGDDIDVNTNVNVPVSVPVEVTGGTQTVEGDHFDSKSLALSNSLGDVDIAGCLGSTQWSTPLFSKQKLVVNWPCLTEFYIRNSMWDNASMAICNTEVRKEFDTEEACRAAHPFQMMVVPAAAVVEDSRDEENERELHQELMTKQQEYLNELERRLEQVENRRTTSPRPQTIIQRESFLDDEKRAALEQLRSTK